jgi:hypothetical protein
MQGMLLACNSGEKQQITETKKTEPFSPGTFGYDLNFLSQHGDIVVLNSADSSAQVIVSAKYQGKVFTSTAGGNSGQSFGWVNYKAFDGPLNKHMNAYGGENRLWLGPEGGRFSLFFQKGDSMIYEHWKTPAAFDREAWTLVSHSQTSAEMEKTSNLVNYAGTELFIRINRTITILSNSEISTLIGISGDSNLKVVGYSTENHLTNTGNAEWTEKTGMPCIWMLDMFKPSSSTVIVIPYAGDFNDPIDKVVTSNYFGQIPAERLKNKNGVLFFKADGKSRGKLGIHPARAKPIIGSYDSLDHTLTVILFDYNPKAKFLNQEWNTTKAPFSGDAVNAYNDGPLADGTQMGPFYEMESVSPAAFLKPGEAQSHKHTVIHFTGPRSGLDTIAKKMLGVSLSDIEQIF